MSDENSQGRGVSTRGKGGWAGHSKEEATKHRQVKKKKMLSLQGKEAAGVPEGGTPEGRTVQMNKGKLIAGQW